MRSGASWGVCEVAVGSRRLLLASAGSDGTIRIWDPATGAQQAVLEGQHGEVTGLCEIRVADRRLLASASSDGAIQLWDPANARQSAAEDYPGAFWTCVSSMSPGTRNWQAS